MSRDAAAAERPTIGAGNAWHDFHIRPTHMISMLDSNAWKILPCILRDPRNIFLNNVHPAPLMLGVFVIRLFLRQTDRKITALWDCLVHQPPSARESTNSSSL